MSGRLLQALALRHLVFPLFAILPAAAFAGTAPDNNARILWVSAGDSVFKISPVDEMPVLELAGLSHILALTVNETNNQVWLYSHRHLRAYDAQGNIQVDTEMPRNFHDDSPAGMVVDSVAGNVWIGIHRKLYRFDLDGNLQAVLDFKHDITGLALDKNRSRLWVVDRHNLMQLDKTGNTLLTVNLNGGNKPAGIVYDASVEHVWVTSKHRLTCYDTAGNQILSIQTSAGFEAGNVLAADGMGGLWATSKRRLAHFDQNGALQFTRQLFLADRDEEDAGKIVGLASDSRNHTAWVAGHAGLQQFDIQGNLLQRLDSRTWMGESKHGGEHDNDDDEDGIRHIALYAGKSQPRVSITKPQNLDYTNQNRPVVSIVYEGTDSGVDPASIVVSANGLPMQVTCTTTDTTAECTPLTAFQDGTYLLSLTVADRAGTVSEPASVTFTVDTLPPAPPVGALIGFETGPDGGIRLTVQAGSVAQDVKSVTVTNIRTGEITTGIVGADGTLTLQVPGKGADEFSIALLDLAGNTSAPIYMHSGDPPLQLAVASPADGATMDGNIVNVTGTFQGALNTGITVNGIPAAIYGNQWAVNNLPLKPGINTLAVTAVTDGGLTITKISSVTSNGMSSLVLNATPVSNDTAPFAVTFRYQFLGPAAPRSLRIDYTGNGNYLSLSDPTAPLSYSYSAPGVYPVTLILTGGNNQEYQARQLVVIQDPVQMDFLFQGIWGDMQAALVSGNRVAAMNALDGTAQRNYAQTFDMLMPHAKDIFSTFSPLLRSAISGSIGEYAIVRPENGQQNLFLIYFVKTQDGIWRLDAM